MYVYLFRNVKWDYNYDGNGIYEGVVIQVLIEFLNEQLCSSPEIGSHIKSTESKSILFERIVEVHSKVKLESECYLRYIANIDGSFNV